MHLIDAAELGQPKVGNVDASLSERLVPIVRDQSCHIAVSSDISQSIPLKTTGEHIVAPGVVLHTTSWPGLGSALYKDGLVGAETAPPIKTDDLLTDLEKSGANFGNFSIIFTSKRLYKDLFSVKPERKGKVASDVLQLLSQLLKVAESYIPADLRPGIKVFCAFESVERKTFKELQKIDH